MTGSQRDPGLPEPAPVETGSQLELEPEDGLVQASDPGPDEAEVEPAPVTALEAEAAEPESAEVPAEPEAAEPDAAEPEANGALADALELGAEPEAEPAPEPAPEPEPAPRPEPGPGRQAGLRRRPHARGRVEPEPDDDPLPGRPAALRLARLHIRTGAVSLARAELESLAGRGLLDEEALVDLAEVRWRTGDLAGAGEAANAAITRGQRDGLALVIAAEAVAALGRPSEARRLAARALGTVEGPLDPIFAGMPRSAIWPGDHMLDTGSADVAVDRARAVAGGAAVGATAAAAEAFAGGRAALNRGDTATAALRLGIALRLDPGFARGVLDMVEDRSDAPLLALVAGDALRLLGREAEAMEAYDRARGRVPDEGPLRPEARDGSS